MNEGSSAAGLAGPFPAAPGGLEISGVTVRFGGLTALDDVSLTAAPRQVTGIIGPNGAGKTTLLNATCGFVKPQSGVITFDGHELTGIRPHRLAGLGIARTLQGVGLFRGLTVAENVMVGATQSARAGFWSGFFGLPRSDRDERRLREEALQALGRVGVSDVADSMPETLAFGLRKRVALARALVGHPRLLLLDEPASGLSEKELPELGELIKNLASEASVVVIEHRMDLVMSVCDTIFVLDFGRLIAKGTPEQVQADPAVTAAYLGTEVRAGAEGERGARELADLTAWRGDADGEGPGSEGPGSDDAGSEGAGREDSGGEGADGAGAARAEGAGHE
jgi:branched-chain amino acid transport system ATP-binding protein